jgi:purine catabolism regulator
MKIREILTWYQDFDGIHVICGEGGLDNEIRGIEALETNETAYLTNPGDFVYTSGYCMSNGDVSAENWIKIFLQRGVVGLGIKLGLFLDELPLNVYKIANENNFPVLSIPQDVKQEDIVRPIVAKLLEDEQLDNSVWDSFAVALCNISNHEHYTLDSVIKLLRKYIEYPIELVWNNSFEPINVQNILTANNSRNFLHNRVNTLHPAANYTVLSGDTNKYSIFKINNALETIAFLTVILNTEQMLSRVQIAMIQEILPMLTVCLLCRKSSPLKSPKSPGDFLGDVIDGVYDNWKHEMRENALYLNIDFQTKRVLFMIEFVENDQERYERYLRATVEFFEHIGKLFVYVRNKTALHKNKPVFVGESKDMLDIKQLQNTLSALRIHLRKKFKNMQCDIGVSDVVHSLDMLENAYNKAEFSLQIGKKLDENSHIYFYDTYKVYHLLSEIWGMPTFSKIFKNTIGRILAYDEVNKSSLVDDLITIVDCDFSINRSSRVFNVDPKTLKKRLEHICSITCLDMQQVDNQVIMSIMSRMKKIID